MIIVLILFSLLMMFIVTVATGMGGVGAFIGVLLFVCGLPGLIIVSIIYGQNSDTQDRDNYRTENSDLPPSYYSDENFEILRRQRKEAYYNSKQEHINYDYDDDNDSDYDYDEYDDYNDDYDDDDIY